MIVGLGAVGGVEALEEFFAHLPGREIDAAYVVIAPGASDRNGSLIELIARHTDLEVRTAAEGEELKSRHIYVSQAGAVLALEGTRLRTREHYDGGPIDSFFSTLGREQHEHAIGVILHGAGSDGALGLEVIKNAGGLTIAQARDQDASSRESTSFARGTVDLVLPIEQIGARVRDYAHSLRLRCDGAGDQERRTAEGKSEPARDEQQRLLISELNHRVRNMLQVVIGLCHQTLHRSRDLKEFEREFMGRLQALARAYELLSRDGWNNVALADLLRTQLSPFAPGRKCSVDGEPVRLTADAALSLGLVLYELATNATKYGALSRQEGHIDVSWRVQDAARDERGADVRQLVLTWAEHGGPAVVSPTHHGFGSELIERQLKYELNGCAAMDFSPEGLRVTLTVPATEAIHSLQ